jgi:hypothetical protein
MASCRRSRKNNMRKASRKNNMRKASRKNNMRKASRKNNMRKASRKNNMRKASRKNNMYGGAYNPMNLSLAQGQEFNEIHSRQHGGGVPLSGAPVGDQGLLPAELRDMARIGPLDGKLGEIVGMRDPDQVAVAPQAGGGRRRKASRKNRKGSRKASRKNRKASRKNRKASRKNRKASRRNARRNNMNMMGGSYPGDGAPLSSPNMLLSASQAAKAGTADFSNPWMRN